MKRLAIALLLLPALSGCGFYGGYAVLRDEAVKAEVLSHRTLMASEIMWTESIYNALAAEIAVHDPHANKDDDVIETISVTASSTTDETLKTITLTETKPNSGVFRGPVALVRSFDELTGVPTVATPTQIVVSADQDEVGLEASYSAARGVLKAQAKYIESLMHFGIALDADGVTPIAGATVTLESGDAAARTTTARSDGTYAFYGLASGTYTLKVLKEGSQVGQSQVFNR